MIQKNITTAYSNIVPGQVSISVLQFYEEQACVQDAFSA